MAAVIRNRPKTSSTSSRKRAASRDRRSRPSSSPRRSSRGSIRTRRTTSRPPSSTRPTRGATATTAAGGASTPTRTTTTAGARSAARRCARTTPSTRSSTLDVTPEKVADVARRMGVRSPLDVNGAYVPSIGLGSIAVSPLDLTSAYSTLAAGGVHADPRPSGRSSSQTARDDTDAGWGEAEAASRDLRGRRRDRHAHPRGERPVRHGYAGRIRPAGSREDRNERGARGRLVRRVHAELATTVWVGFTTADPAERARHRRGRRYLSGRDLAALHGARTRRDRPGVVPGAGVWPTWKPFTRGNTR